jgi:Domain of Unknown Function with PDB structure (DUF3857)
MRLTTAVFFICMLFASAGSCQIPEFGKIDNADLLATECSFDKGAEAFVLIEWGSTYYDKGSAASLFKTVFEYRRRVKILNEKGMAEADVRIPYYSHNNDEKIIKISANTYSIDAAGNVHTTAVKKGSIYSKRINNYFSELTIAFPEVKPGCVIEYKYTMERETMGDLHSWYFQGQLPVRYSEYQIKVPQIFRFSVQPSVIDPVEKKEKVSSELLYADTRLLNTKTLESIYIMRNLPAIKNEPFMSTPKDYMQRLEFQLSQIDFGNGNVRDLQLSWDDIVNNLNKHSDFGLQLEKEINSNTVTEQAKQISNLESRLQFIYDYLKRTLNWNNNESIYTENGIAKTWETKTGNTADINLLLVKILKDAGINASPVLFSTRNNGLVNSNFPFLDQFNIIMAAATINDKIFVLDGTDKFNSYKMVPHKVTNSEGFIVDGESGRWKSFFSGNYKYKMMAAIRGEVDSNGIIKGDVLISSNDYARAERCNEWKKDAVEFRVNNFNTAGCNCIIEGFTVNNVEADSLPLEQKINYTSSLSGSGNYRYFNTNTFTGFDKNPFISDERISDIDFGYNQDYTIYGNYNIPDGYIFEGLPENISMIMPDTSIIFTRTVQAEENLLNLRISIEFKKPYYPVTDYPEFSAFYKKMLAKLNEQIVIKKKGT